MANNKHAHETLLHYSHTRLTHLYSTPVQSTDFKPKGLWVSVKGPDDWMSWCIENQFRIEGLRFVHKITLTNTAKIFRINNVQQMDAFTHEYGSTLQSRSPSIKWDCLSDYDGIIIAPYLWKRRHIHMWYYTWDCASGCICKTDAIQSIELFPHSPSKMKICKSSVPINSRSTDLIESLNYLNELLD